MALQHLRSSTANKRPTPAAMSDGQLAMNTNLASPGLFFKDSNGDLVKAGPVHVGATAPNVTPASGGTAGNSKGEAWLDTSGTNPLLKVWSGSAWQTVQPVVNGNVVSTADTGTVTSAMIVDGTIVNADINASAAIVDTKLATIATAGKVSNSATTATSANTASAIVARDASGNFSAGTITASLTGAASSNVLKAGDTMTGALATPLGSATAPSLTFSGDTNTGIYSPGADQVAVATNGSGRLFVDASGNVGVGITGPAQLLHINSTGTSAILRVSSGSAGVNTSTSSIQLSSSFSGSGVEGTAQINANAPAGGQSELAFLTSASGNAPTERLRITSAGLVGIGTSSPATRLHISNGELTVSNGNNIAGAGGIINFGIAALPSFSPMATIQGSLNNATGTELQGGLGFFTRPGGAAGQSLSQRMTITGAGNVGIGTTSPSSLLTVAGKVTLTGPEDNQLEWNQSGQAWRANTSAAGTWYLLDSTNSKFPLNVEKNSTSSVSIGSSFVSLGAGGSERARIDSSGRFLVGTSTGIGLPIIDALFQVNEGGGRAVCISKSTVDAFGPTINLAKSRGSFGTRNLISSGDGTGSIIFWGDDGSSLVPNAQISTFVDGTPGANDMPGRLVFSVTADGASSPTERMTIKADGKVGIATSSPGYTLEVAGSAAAHGWQTRTGANGAFSGHTFNIYWDGTNARLYIDNTDLGSISVSSDYRIKKNIQSISSNCIDRIRQLRPVQYELNDYGSLFKTDGVVREGFIAHEVQEVIPSGAEGEKDEEDRIQNLRTDAIVAVVTKALQEAIDKIEVLEAKVAALEAS